MVRASLFCLGFALTACSESVPLAPSMIDTEGGVYALHITPSTDAPTAGTDFSLDLMLHDAADDSLVSGATVEVEPFMPEHGHGVSDEPVVTETETAGMYMATWQYTMPGTWEVTVHVMGEPGHDHAVFGYEVE